MSASTSVVLRHRAAVFAAQNLASIWSRRIALASLVTAAVLLPLSLRVLHMIEGGYSIWYSDWAGIVSDLAIGAALSLALALMLRVSTALFLAGFGVWFALNAGYYEFLREFGSSYFLIHAGYMLDGTFLAGSGSNLTHPFLFGPIALSSIAAIFCLFRSSRDLDWRLLAGLSAAFAVSIPLIPGEPNMPMWRQSDFVTANIRDVGERLLFKSSQPDPRAAPAIDLESHLKPDLTGTSILPASGRKRNVILLFLEGVSGLHLPSLADAHGVRADLEMPLLDATARENLAFATFVTHQKQSNRGMYSAICGDYPKLAAATPEMSEIANGAGKRCLPAVLRSNGYNTLFMKSADGGYMFMAPFMRKAGFDRAFGEEGVDTKYFRSEWGLDDRSLYDAALEQIEALDQQEEPYFLTLFTSGTHHPFELPPEYGAFPDRSARQRAWAYADQSLDDFLRKLRESGRLDDTLVLISSDEAATESDLKGGRAKLKGLSDNWGFMVAVAPERVQGRIDAAFQQSDIPLSILDYLGLENDANFIGRSLFRRYRKGRSIYFANIYKRRIYEYVEGDALTSCDETLDSCVRYDAGRATLFSDRLESAQENAQPSPMLRAVKAHSMKSFLDREPPLRKPTS